MERGSLVRRLDHLAHNLKPGTSLLLPKRGLILRSQLRPSTAFQRQTNRCVSQISKRHFVMPRQQREPESEPQPWRTGFSFLTDDSFDVTRADALDQVKAAIRTLAITGVPPLQQQIVLLATPKFLPLVQNDGQLLELLAKQALCNPDRQRRWTSVEITTAVVDRIPFPKTEDLNSPDMPPQDLSVASLWGAEGISVTTLLERWTEPAQPAELVLQPPGTIAVQVRRRNQHQISTKVHLHVGGEVTFRLANTVMTTGQNHFLKGQVWKRAGGGGGDVRKTEDLSLQSCFLQPMVTPSKEDLAYLRGSVDLAQLTPPRRVRSAFGNVIKSFEGAEDYGREMPASQELENTLPALREQLARKPEVWALVIPAELLPNYSYSHNTIPLFIRKGISCYRVSGGGGGWSGSGGPISLEIDDGLSSLSEPSHQTIPDFESLNSIVPKGAYVVFVAPLIGKTQRRQVQRTVSDPDESEFFFASAPAAEGWEDVVPTQPSIVDNYFAALSGQLGYQLICRPKANVIGNPDPARLAGGSLPHHGGFYFKSRVPLKSSTASLVPDSSKLISCIRKT